MGCFVLGLALHGVEEREAFARQQLGNQCVRSFLGWLGGRWAVQKRSGRRLLASSSATLSDPLAHQCECVAFPALQRARARGVCYSGGGGQRGAGRQGGARPEAVTGGSKDCQQSSWPAQPAGTCWLPGIVRPHGLCGSGASRAAGRQPVAAGSWRSVRGRWHRRPAATAMQQLHRHACGLSAPLPFNLIQLPLFFPASLPRSALSRCLSC